MSDEQPEPVDPEVARREARYSELVNHLKTLTDDLKKGRDELEVCLDAVVSAKRFLDADKAVLMFGATRPLEIVAVSLRELSLGGRPRLFRQKRTVGHRPAGMTAPIQAVAAAGIEALHGAGVDFGQAATFVVRELQKIGVTHTGPRRAISTKTVLGWRDEMRGRNSPEAVAMYDEWLDSFKRTFGPDTSRSVIEGVVAAAIAALRDSGFDGRQIKSE
jgi:hypothetical protein